MIRVHVMSKTPKFCQGCRGLGYLPSADGLADEVCVACRGTGRDACVEFRTESGAGWSGWRTWMGAA